MAMTETQKGTLFWAIVIVVGAAIWILTARLEH